MVIHNCNGSTGRWSRVDWELKDTLWYTSSTPAWATKNIFKKNNGYDMSSLSIKALCNIILTCIYRVFPSFWVLTMIFSSFTEEICLPLPHHFMFLLILFQVLVHPFSFHIWTITNLWNISRVAWSNILPNVLCFDTRYTC